MGVRGSAHFAVSANVRHGSYFANTRTSEIGYAFARYVSHCVCVGKPLQDDVNFPSYTKQRDVVRHAGSSMKMRVTGSM